MSMDWREVIGAVAPTIATALGGPLAGLGVEALGKALGISEPNVKKLQDVLAHGQLTGDHIAALKQAEMAIKIRMRELDIQEEQLASVDRDSARKMQISNKSLVPPVLATLIVILVCTAEGMLLFGTFPSTADPILIGRIMGTLDSALMLVLSFYFGSSSSSERKTEIMAQSAATAAAQ
jgi:hypothetical protein